jgi:hypothetical protein
MKIDELVGLYVRLRDKKAEIKGEYDAKIAPIDQKLDKIEAKVLEVMQKVGMDAIRTANGTVYSEVRTSSTTADKAAFLDFVREHDLWQLVDMRPLKSGIKEYIDVNNDLPPGINWREERTVQFRRAA